MVNTTDIDRLRKNLIKLTRDDKGKMKVALTVHARVKNRIFGGSGGSKDSSGRAIGRYSDGYVNQRIKAGHTSNRAVQLRGIAKTTPKGTPRGKNNYIISGQMQEDFQVIRDGSVIGSGFNNKANYDKSVYVENTYKKDIFSMTPGEEKYLVELIDKLVEQKINA